jgi:hypothetical protein
MFFQALLVTHIMLASWLIYSLTQKMEVTCTSEVLMLLMLGLEDLKVSKKELEALKLLRLKKDIRILQAEATAM